MHVTTVQHVATCTSHVPGAEVPKHTCDHGRASGDLIAPGQHSVNNGSARPSTDLLSPSTDSKMAAASSATSTPKFDVQKSTQNSCDVRVAFQPRCASALNCAMTSCVRHWSPMSPSTSDARFAMSRVRFTQSSTHPSASSDSIHGMIHAL